MPTYEYACKNCGEHTEAVQAFADAALTECTSCGGPLRKIFGNVGITFKGSGFYKTDSRGAGPAKSSGDKSEGGSDNADRKADTSATKTESGSSEKGSKESTPASKSDSSPGSGTKSSSSGGSNGSPKTPASTPSESGSRSSSSKSS